MALLFAACELSPLDVARLFAACELGPLDVALLFAVCELGPLDVALLFAACELGPLDVALIVDSSAIIQESNWDIIKSFLASFVASFGDVGTQTRVGCLSAQLHKDGLFVSPTAHKSFQTKSNVEETNKNDSSVYFLQFC